MDLDEYIRRANEYTSDQYANDFINLLSKYNERKGDKFYLTINHEVNVIRASGYYAYLSFKNLVCELFHGAIKSIPNIISEYTITCRNSAGTTMIKIGLFDDLDGDGGRELLLVIEQVDLRL